MEHIEDRLNNSAPLVTEVDTNTVTGEPQVYKGKAPQDGMPGADPMTGYAPPHVVYYSQSAGSLSLQAQAEDWEDAEVWQDGLWTVLVVGPAGDEGRVDRAMSAILEALQGTEGLVPSGEGYVVLTNLSSSVWLAPQAVEGVDYLRRGWTFRIQVQPPIP